MARHKTSKPGKLKKLLEELHQEEKQESVSKIEDTLTAQQKTRLKPLAWLIAREQYTMDEVLKCVLAYEESSVKRAEDILKLIRSRQKNDAGKKL